MMNHNLLDELTEKIARLMPQAQALGKEAKDSLRGALQQTFAKMDLVTREEFDAQTRALQRAEQKLAELEALITALESRRED